MKKVNICISKKVVLIGDFAVGKTSLVKKFVHSIFSAAYHTTLGVKVDKKEVTVKETLVNMMLWDIAGEKSMKSIEPIYCVGAHAFIYVFDLSRPSSWTKLEENIHTIQKRFGDTTPIIIVGNKKDLINPADLFKLVTKVPITPHILCSAQTGENVDTLFKLTASMMI